MLKDFKINEEELNEMMGIDLEEELTDTTKKGFILNLAFEYLVKEIYFLNDSINERKDIEIKIDNEDKIYAFKWCQAKIIFNLLHNEKIIYDESIDNTIRFELKLSKINGMQK